MTAPTPARPISRPRVLLGVLLVTALLGGVVVLSEALRHPPVGPRAEPDGGDPRDETVCPDRPAPELGAVGMPRRGTGAVRVSSTDLYDCPEVYDGRFVRYEGEVVGALLRRAEGAWTQLNDDAYAGDLGPLPEHRDYRGANSGVGVLLADDVADQVETVAGPAVRGDVLAVTGTFHRVDPDSGESAVIHAGTGTVERRGGPVEQRPLPSRRAVGILLAVAAAGGAAAHRIATRLQRVTQPV